MEFWARCRDFYATALVVSFLTTLQVSGLTTQLPSSQVSRDTQKNTHRTLVLESSELVLNPSRPHVVSPELQATPEINERQPSPDYYDDATERLDLSSTANDSILSSSSSRHRMARASSSLHTPLMSGTQGAALPWQHLLITNYPSLMENHSILFPHVLEDDRRKVLMLVLKAEDCQKFSRADFESMLVDVLEKYGFEDAVSQVSTAKCYSHLTITVTLNSSVPTLRFIPNLESKSNVTADVLNRTFRIVKLEKVDIRLQRKKPRSNNDVIASIATHESVAYLALGICLGLTVVACFAICFFKLCCGPEPAPRRRLRKQRPGSGPGDYVLRPLPKASTSSNHRTRYPRIIKYEEASRISPLEPLQEERVSTDASVILVEEACGTSKDSQHQTANTSTKSDLHIELNNMKNIQKVSPAEGVPNPTFERY